MDPLDGYLESKGADPLDAYLGAKSAAFNPTPDPEEGANPIAAWARRRLGIAPEARFSLGEVGRQLTDVGSEGFFPGTTSPLGSADPTKPIPKATAPITSPKYSPVPWSPGENKKYNDAGPLAEDWGAQAIVGTLMGNAAGRFAGPVVGKVASKLGVPTAAAPTVGRVAGAGLEGGVGSKAQGGDIIPGAALGAGLSMLGPLGSAITKTRGGMARQFIEDHGGEAGLLSPGKGKPFDEMVTRGTTDADIGMQAKASAEAGLGMLNQEKKAVLGTLGNRIGALNESSAGRAPRDVSSLVPKIQEALGEIDIADASEAQLAKALDKITKKQKPGFNPDTDPYVLSEADLNRTRRRLDRAARTGQAVDEKLSPLKQAANEARTMVDEGPYREPNKAYAKESKNYQKSRRLLGINERPRTPEETQTAIEKVTNVITRRGQNTPTAGKQLAGEETNLRAFDEKHPDIGNEFAKPGMLRAKGDLEFGILPRKHGGLTDRLSGAVGGGAALDAAAALAGHANPKLAIANIAGYLAMRNLPAIQGRLLYTPAKLAMSNEAELLKLIPLLNAARNAAGDNP